MDNDITDLNGATNDTSHSINLLNDEIDALHHHSGSIRSALREIFFMR
jgi:hypothetical protein